MVRQLQHLGFVVVKHDPSGDGAGEPDLFVLWDGVVAAVETKTPRGKLSSAQKMWRDQWLLAGGVYVVARRAEDVLREYGRIV